MIEKLEERSKLVSYNPNYGTHVNNYPASGSSEYYYTEKLPVSPRGFTNNPPPPPKYTVSIESQQQYDHAPIVSPQKNIKKH